MTWQLLCPLPAHCVQRGAAASTPHPPPFPRQPHLPAHPARSCREPQERAMVGASDWRAALLCHVLLPCPSAGRSPPCRLRTASSSARCWPQTPAGLWTAARCSPAATAAPSPTSSRWMNWEKQDTRRWFHLVFLRAVILYLSANSPTVVCSPVICNKRKSTQMCVIAFSHYMPTENKSLNLTVSVKTKGSTKPSSSGLCLEQKPCCQSRLQLPICTQGSHPGSAGSLHLLSCVAAAPGAGHLAPLQHSHSAHLQMAQQLQMEDFRGMAWSIFEFILMLSLNYKSVT